MRLERAALFLQLLIVDASDKVSHGTANTSTQTPNTKQVQATDGKNIYVVDLTQDSFNESVVNGSHFLMFYDPT